jgi:hypothetical protein
VQKRPTIMKRSLAGRFRRAPAPASLRQLARARPTAVRRFRKKREIQSAWKRVKQRDRQSQRSEQRSKNYGVHLANDPRVKFQPAPLRREDEVRYDSPPLPHDEWVGTVRRYARANQVAGSAAPSLCRRARHRQPRGGPGRAWRQGLRRSYWPLRHTGAQRPSLPSSWTPSGPCVCSATEATFDARLASMEARRAGSVPNPDRHHRCGAPMLVAAASPRP